MTCIMIENKTVVTSMDRLILGIHGGCLNFFNRGSQLLVKAIYMLFFCRYVYYLTGVVIFIG